MRRDFTTAPGTPRGTDWFDFPAEAQGPSMAAKYAQATLPRWMVVPDDPLTGLEPLYLKGGQGKGGGGRGGKKNADTLIATSDSGEGFTTEAGKVLRTANVLQNDTGAGTLNITALDASNMRGALTDLGDGTFAYDPGDAFATLALGETATERFAYTVTDGQGNSATAWVEITVKGTYEPPADPLPDDPPPSDPLPDEPVPDEPVPDEPTPDTPDSVALTPEIEALLQADIYRWNKDDAPGTATTVSFAFLSKVPDYYGATSEVRDGFQAFTSAQEAAARTAMALIESYTNLSFVEVAEGEAEITFGNAEISQVAYAYGPVRGYNLGGDVWMSATNADNLAAIPGGDGFMAMLHELGHALGLEHSHDGAVSLDASMDTRQYTVMSYLHHKGTYGEEPGTYMTLDIQALQYLYGVNDSHALGNDVYSYDDVARVETIWDSGGHDVLDASAATSSVALDLNAGAYCSVGRVLGYLPAYQNLAIAEGTVIEEAIGGGAADTITGNSADNVLTGNGGGDLFRFEGQWGADVITDFELGLDRLEVTGTSAAPAMTATADGLRLDYDNGSILLAGIEDDGSGLLWV